MTARREEIASRPPLAAEDPKDAAISRHLALSTVSNYLGQVVNLAVWFLLTPFLVRKLGATQYGLWVLVASFIAYGSLLDFGVGDAIVKYVAEFRARGDDDSASRLVATSLWLYCALGLLVFVIGVALAPLVPKLINVPPSEQHTASLLVILTALGVAVELPADGVVLRAARAAPIRPDEPHRERRDPGARRSAG